MQQWQVFASQKEVAKRTFDSKKSNQSLLKLMNTKSVRRLGCAEFRADRNRLCIGEQCSSSLPLQG